MKYDAKAFEELKTLCEKEKSGIQIVDAEISALTLERQVCLFVILIKSYQY